MALRVVQSWLAQGIRRALRIDEQWQSQQALAKQLCDMHERLIATLSANELARRADSEAAHGLAQETVRLLEDLDARLHPLGSYLTAAAQTAAAELAPVNPGDSATLERLEQRGLFILGSGRSGTTILTKCFNRAPEIFMLEEPNFFQHQHIQDFVAFFNAMHPAMGNCRYKGTYVPPALSVEIGPLGLMDRLTRQYRFAGEKVAIGPHDYPSDWKDLYLDFHAKYFMRSKRFLTVRSPNEALWSMHKLFPRSSIPKLFEAWLESLALSIDVYRVCPHSYLLFFNDFGPAMLSRISQLLEVEIPVPESMLGGNYVRSRLREDGLAPPLDSYADLASECLEVFHELRNNVSPETFAYCGAANEWEFFDSLRRRIQALVQRARADEPQWAAA